MRKRGRFYLALFHFQQAAEKALKAYLYLKAESFEGFYTHSVDDLLTMAIEINPDFKARLPKNNGGIYSYGLAIHNEQGIDIDLVNLFKLKRKPP